MEKGEQKHWLTPPHKGKGAEWFLTSNHVPGTVQGAPEASHLFSNDRLREGRDPRESLHGNAQPPAVTRLAQDLVQPVSNGAGAGS